MSVIIPIDIAIETKKKVIAALAGVDIDERLHVFASGVADDTESEQGDIIIFPLVRIHVGLCLPQQYRSVLREYPIIFQAITTRPQDPTQLMLYTIADKLSAWLCEPDLSGMTAAHWDALTIEALPEGPTVIDENLQAITWQTMCKTRKAS